MYNVHMYNEYCINNRDEPDIRPSGYKAGYPESSWKSVQIYGIRLDIWPDIRYQVEHQNRIIYGPFDTLLIQK